MLRAMRHKPRYPVELWGCILTGIDEGIRVAQERLWHRAQFNHQTLVVAQDGKIVEFVPDADGIAFSVPQGDPLLQQKTR